MAQAGTRSDGRCNTWTSQIITDCRLSKNEAFTLAKCTCYINLAGDHFDILRLPMTLCDLSHSQNSQNPDCAQDIIVIFDSMVWFLGLANLTVCQLNLPWNDPCCHGNKIRDKIVYNSTYIRNIDEIIALSWAFSR